MISVSPHGECIYVTEDCGDIAAYLLSITRRFPDGSVQGTFIGLKAEALGEQIEGLCGVRAQAVVVFDPAISFKTKTEVIMPMLAASAGTFTERRKQRESDRATTSDHSVMLEGGGLPPPSYP